MAHRGLLTMVALGALAAAPASTAAGSARLAPGVATAADGGAVLASSAAPGAGGTVGIRLLDAPASAAKDPRARLYIVDHLAPGTVIRRRIEVSSTAPARTRGVLYAAAAGIANGSFRGADARTVNELSSWTSVSPGVVDLTKGARKIATVTIAIPSDASPGERYGVVWAETRAALAAGGGVVDVSRVGIRLYVSVGPGNPPAANLAIESLAAHRGPDGRPMVVAKVRNTGGRALDMSGTLQLDKGPGGLRAGPFAAKLGTTMHVGATEAVTILLDAQLPAGPWEAKLTLRSGLVQRSAGATITFPASGASAAVSTESSWQSWMTAGLGVVVLLLVVATFVLLRRHRRPVGL